jgi:hypothetical protein
MKGAIRLVLRFSWVAFVTTGALTAMAQGDGIVIRVLNGKNGKPVSGEHLVVFTGSLQQTLSSARANVQLQTDLQGTAILRLDAAVERVQVWVDWHVLCQQTPNAKSYSVEEIEKKGLTTQNDCGAVQKTAAPGELVIFARPAHFWEKMSQ